MVILYISVCSLPKKAEINYMIYLPHITLCTLNDGKPSDSNYITEWRNLETPIKVKGVWQLV